MALYHKWDVKNGFTFEFKFFMLISESLDRWCVTFNVQVQMFRSSCFRIFILVPHMRKVVSELCKGFKEILLVAILLSVMIFVFANYAVHLFGMRFASCNDQTIKDR